MNMSAFVGIALTVAAFVLGTLLGGPLAYFVDIISMIFVAIPLACILLLTHRWDDLRVYGMGGLRTYLFPNRENAWGPAQRLKAARIANSVGTQAIMLGALGTYIGCVSMLQNLEDPTKIGPALAVACLTVLYGLLINALVCMPMARHHALAALQAGANPTDLDQDHPLRNILLILALLGASVGASFFILLLSMSSWG